MKLRLWTILAAMLLMVSAGWGQGDMLVVDMDGNGIGLVPLNESHAQFDWRGGTKPAPTAWIAAGDGFLAHDDNGNGIVDGANELFMGRRAADAFSDLAARADYNKDGKVDATDEGWDKLLLWVDVNADGVCQPGEAMPLAQAGIAMIDVKERPAEDDRGEMRIIAKSFLKMTDGMYHPVYSVAFPSLREQAQARIRKARDEKAAERR